MNQFSLVVTAIFISLTLAPASVMAQASVSDPGASVPIVVYQTVFNQSPTGVETKLVDWKKANIEVGQFKRGHVDILKWDENQLKDKPVDKPAAKPEPAPVKAAPSPANPIPAPTAAPNPHKH